MRTTEAPGYFAQVSGVKLYYQECNAAAPIGVVLLHGASRASHADMVSFTASRLRI